jgi:hypothetical protein
MGHVLDQHEQKEGPRNIRDGGVEVASEDEAPERGGVHALRLIRETGLLTKVSISFEKISTITNSESVERFLHDEAHPV